MSGCGGSNPLVYSARAVVVEGGRRQPSACRSVRLKARERKRLLHVSIRVALRASTWDWGRGCRPGGGVSWDVEVVVEVEAVVSNAFLKEARIEQVCERVLRVGEEKRRR